MLRVPVYLSLLVVLLILGATAFFFQKANEAAQSPKKMTDGSLEKLVQQTLRSSFPVANTKLSTWWSSYLTTSARASHLKQQHHRSLGPGQKEVEDLAAASSNTNRVQFGPEADWSCTTKGAVDYVSCVEGEKSDNEKFCSWCPLGGEYGICLHQQQATIVNSMDNWHLKCNPPGPKEDADGIAFWAEAMECAKHNLDDCLGGDHGKEKCTWCENISSEAVHEPSVRFCTSQILWDQMSGLQRSVEEGHINVDQVFSCKSDANEIVDDTGTTSLFDATCAREGSQYTELKTEEDYKRCTDTLDMDDVNCTIAKNPFPGVFMGSTSGLHCVSESQSGTLRLIFRSMKDMGWEIE